MDQFRWNDAGRSTSKRPKQKNDCTVRAIALTCKVSYDEAYDAVATMGRKSGQRWDIPKKPFELFGNYLIWHPLQAVKGEPRMRCCDMDQISNRMILRISKHVFAVVDGVVLDTSCDYMFENCVYGYWTVRRK